MKGNWKHSVFILLLAEFVFWIVGGTVYQYFFLNFSEFRMEHEEFWIYLLGSRVLFIIFILSRLGVRNRLKKYANGDTLTKITHNFSVLKNTFNFATLLYGISFLILAWANPQFGKDEKKMNASGIDIMVCLDVSNSMLAKDLAGNMNRLEIAKLAIRNLLRELKGDRVGVVVFAGSAYDYIPITNDYEYIKLEMLSINPGMMSTQGTAIGAAIETAMNSFEQNKTNKAILVFTDGENHEDNALKVAQSAKSKGAKVYTIGMGTNRAVPIPKSENRNDFHKDKDGNTVLTKLNEKMLQEVATKGNGIFVIANKTRVDTKSILKDIDKIEKTKFKQKIFLEYEDRFQWFLGIGLLFLLVNGLIGKVV